MGQSNQHNVLLYQHNINHHRMSSKIALGWRWPKRAREPTEWMLLVLVMIITQEQHVTWQEARLAPRHWCTTPRTDVQTKTSEDPDGKDASKLIHVQKAQWWKVILTVSNRGCQIRCAGHSRAWSPLRPTPILGAHHPVSRVTEEGLEHVATRQLPGSPCEEGQRGLCSGFVHLRLDNLDQRIEILTLYSTQVLLF